MRWHDIRIGINEMKFDEKQLHNWIGLYHIRMGCNAWHFVRTGLTSIDTTRGGDVGVDIGAGPMLGL